MADGRAELLSTIEAYYDAIPRTAARAEVIGPFTLFVNPGPGERYYARPTIGATSFAVADVVKVRERQRELGVPEAFEWVDDISTALRAAVEAAGLSVHEHPLLVLDRRERQSMSPPLGVSCRLVTPEDDLALLGAVAAVAFGAPGTAVGSESASDLAVAAARRTSEAVEFERQRLRTGHTVKAAAFAGGQPVAVGSHRPIGTVSEIVAVGTLPSFRRRGIGAAVTSLLIEDALQRGVTLLFLTADDDAVARIYERVGFRRTAIDCVAEPA